MMQHNQHQPFFKPITGMDTQFCVNERTSSALTTPRTTVSAGSYFAPLNQQNVRLKEIEVSQRLELGMDQQGNTERLGTLHKRLYQEAEKIRKWKTQTEIDLKQKDRKLQEASGTVENLRKSILELQLQNEDLSLKLQGEMENREEILQKINSTREMCTLLKDYSSTVEERLQLCETEKTELKYLEKEHLKQFEDLSCQFKTLEISATEKNNDLRKKLEEERVRGEALTEECEQKVQKTQGELEKLYKRCEENEATIQEVTKELSEHQEKLDTMNKEYEKVLDLYNQADANFADRSVKLEMTMEDLEKAKESNLKLNTVLDETSARLQEALNNKDKLAQNFDETEKLYLEKIKSLQEDLVSAQQEKDNQSKRLTELNSNFTKTRHTVEDLKCTKDMLMLERTEAQNKIGELERSKTQLLMQKEELEAALKTEEKNTKSLDTQLERFKMVAEDLQRKLQETEGERDAVAKAKAVIEESVNQLTEQQAANKEELEKLRKDLFEALEREKMACEKVDSLEQQLEKEGDEHNTELQGLKSTNRQQQQQLNGCKKEINKLKRDLESAAAREKAIQQTFEEMESALGASRRDLADLEKQLREKQDKVEAKLEEELTNTKGLQDQLENRSKEAVSLEGRMKNLKFEVSAKNKHVKELEKEIRGLKNKLTTKEKAESKKTDENQQLKEELEGLQEQIQKLEEEKGKLGEDLDKQMELLKSGQKEVDSGKKDVDKMTKELQVSKRLHDVEMSKMCNLLEDYKMQNQKIVSDKDKEIEQIKKQIDQQNKQQQSQQMTEISLQFKETKKQLEALTKSSAEQEKQLAQKDALLKEQKKSVAKYEKKVVDAEKNYKKKEEEIQSLQSQITELQRLQQTEAEVEELRKEIEKLRAQPEPQAPMIHVNKPSRIPLRDCSAKTSDEELQKSETKEKEKTPGKVQSTRTGKGPYATTKEVDSAKEPPKTPNSRVVEPKTPAMPVRTTGSKTPTVRMTVPRTPKNTTIKTQTVRLADCKTPSKSILKSNGESVSKRRKVIFCQSGLKYASDTEPESDASSSPGLMEVENEDIGIGINIPLKDQNTPLVVKPSPRTKIFRQQYLNTENKLTPVLRGKSTDRFPVESKKPKINPIRSTEEEAAKFIELYPDGEPGNISCEKKSKSKTTSNVRRTPCKPVNRFFKASPKEKKRMSLGRKPLKQPEDLAWFDSDAIFGFGPED